MLVAAGITAAGAITSAAIANSGSGTIAERLQNLGIDIDNVNLPETEKAKLRKFTPEEYDIPPELKMAIAKRDPSFRNKVRDTLNEMRANADQAIDSKADASRRMAIMEADQAAGARTNQIRDEMASRGRSASGMEFGLMGQEAQQAANRRMMGGLASASQAGQERMQSLKDYRESLANEENRTIGLDRELAADENAANIFNDQRVRSYRDKNKDLRNSAAMSNIQQEQFNSDYNNRLNQQKFDNRLKKIGMTGDIANRLNSNTASNAANWGQMAGTIGNIAGQGAQSYYASKQQDAVNAQNDAYLDYLKNKKQ